MRHEYVGDIGDFGKYALLKALAGDDLPLGIVWYLNEAREHRNDGLFTEYSYLRSCDPALHDTLLEIVRSGKRSLASIEAANVLPRGTTFYSKVLPYPPAPCFSSVARDCECAYREDWHRDALSALSQAKLVFLDPDNGLAGKVQPHSLRSPKYAFKEEVRDWLDRGKSVVLYQHAQRKSLEEQVRDQLKLLGRSGWPVTFHRMSVRIYYVLPATEHRTVLMDRTRAFLETEWGRERHFSLTTVDT